MSRRDSLEDWLRFARADAHILSGRPALFFQQAAHQPSDSAPTRAALEWAAAGRQQRPWLRWLNKPRGARLCLLTLVGHTAPVSGCVFSADGRQILSISDKTVVRWDVETGVQLDVYSIADERRGRGAISPDGSRIALATSANIQMLDTATGRMVRTLAGHHVAAFSPDGRRIVSVSDWQQLTVLDTATGTCLTTLSGHLANVNDCVFSPDGSLIASASNDTTVRLWESTTGRELATLLGHKYDALACAFSPDGTRLMSADEQGTLRLWDVNARRLLATHPGHWDGKVWVLTPINQCAFSRDGTKFVTASNDGTLKLWDPSEGTLLATLVGHTGVVNACAFSPDGKWLASASDDMTVKLWSAAVDRSESVAGHLRWVAASRPPENARVVPRSEIRDRREATTGWTYITIEGPKDSVTACAFAPDGSRFASAFGDGTLKIWDARSGEECGRLVGHTNVVTTCAFSPDGRRIVSAGLDETLRLWDAETSRELATLTGHEHLIHWCRFTPDGRRIISASEDRTLRFWDARRGKLRKTVAGQGLIRPIALSPDGTRIALAALNDKVKLWDAVRRRRLRTLEGHRTDVTSCTFSHDGSLLATGAMDGDVRLWHARTGEFFTRLPRDRGQRHGGRIHACAFSPDDRLLLTGSADGSLKLWDVRSGAEVTTLSGHSSGVQSAAFSPGGKWIASSDEEMVKLWDTATGRLSCDHCTGSGALITWSPTDRRLVVGTALGLAQLLLIENLGSEEPLTGVSRVKHAGLVDKISRLFGRGTQM